MPAAELQSAGLDQRAVAEWIAAAPKRTGDYFVDRPRYSRYWQLGADLLGREPQLAPHYVLEVRRPHNLDELDVLVEMRPELAGKLGAAENAALAKQAEHLIKAYVGVTATVRVLEPGTIERSQGKAKRVIDRRAKS